MGYMGSWTLFHLYYYELLVILTYALYNFSDVKTCKGNRTIRVQKNLL